MYVPRPVFVLSQSLLVFLLWAACLRKASRRLYLGFPSKADAISGLTSGVDQNAIASLKGGQKDTGAQIRGARLTRSPPERESAWCGLPRPSLQMLGFALTSISSSCPKLWFGANDPRSSLQHKARSRSACLQLDRWSLNRLEFLG